MSRPSLGPRIELDSTAESNWIQRGYASAVTDPEENTGIALLTHTELEDVSPVRRVSIKEMRTIFDVTVGWREGSSRLVM